MQIFEQIAEDNVIKSLLGQLQRTRGQKYCSKYVVEPDCDKVKWSKRGRINQIKLSRVAQKMSMQTKNE